MAKAVDAAYRTIRDGIASGAFAPGTHLTAQKLAEDSGLSRTPVREAMRRLHAEGLIRFLPHRGAFVTSWSEREIDELYELRVLLEGFAAQLAATRASDEALGELERLAEEMRAAVAAHPLDHPAIAAANDRFHKALLDACGNARLRDLLAAVTELPLQLDTFRRYDEARLQRSADQHRELVAALRAGDAEWARSVMTAHLRSAHHALLEG